MITTRRSNDSFYEGKVSGGDIGLLEREEPISFGESAVTESERESEMREAKARMQANLDKILNYDRYSEVVGAENKQEEASAVNVADKVVSDTSVAEDDIRPTSTTMQFGDLDINVVRQEMRSDDEESEKHKLNAKGKLVIALYALAVTIILALIVINTGIINVLSNGNVEKQAMLDQMVNEYNDIRSEISYVTSDGYVIDVAENQYGMIK